MAWPKYLQIEEMQNNYLQFRFGTSRNINAGSIESQGAL